MSDDLAALASEAYIYGFALVFDLQQVGRFTREGMGSLAPAPANRFSHASKLAGPDDRFVSINNDTIYSIAQVDVSGGPVLLRVPDTAGRYYVLQFVDAWTNNFAYVGRRATGTEAGTFLLVPSGWQGEVPAGTQVIEFPTMVGTIVGRWACDGPADLGAVQALQNGLSLEPHGRPAPRQGIPAPAAVPAGLAFFEQMRTWMQAFPPSGPDQAYQKRFTPFGLLDPVSPYADCPPDLARALTAGADAAKQQMETALKDGNLAPVINGWRLTFHMFDYNLDHLGPGTINDPMWKMADRTVSYLARALAARGGLWGNHGYEAAYPMTYADKDGQGLDGHNRYTLTFDQDPPVGAFWSITMYDLPDFYLVANPIGRYSIGDRTPGLRRDADGSLTIVIQHDQPADTSNWLPAPPRRSGRSCACTSRGLPYWTAPIRSRPSPGWRPRPAADSRYAKRWCGWGPFVASGQVQDILACPVNQPARVLPVRCRGGLSVGVAPGQGWLPGRCGPRAGSQSAFSRSLPYQVAPACVP